MSKLEKLQRQRRAEGRVECEAHDAYHARSNERQQARVMSLAERAVSWLNEQMRAAYVEGYTAGRKGRR